MHAYVYLALYDYTLFIYVLLLLWTTYVSSWPRTDMCSYFFSFNKAQSIIAYHRHRNNNNRKTTKVYSWTYFCFFVGKIDIFNISVVPAIMLLKQIIMYCAGALKSIRYLKTVKFIIYCDYEQRSYIEFAKIIKYIIFKHTINRYRILVRTESELIKKWMMGSSIRIVGYVCQKRKLAVLALNIII